MYPYQPIINIAEICVQHGINHVILSPGSRCAPLTIAFARHPKITTRTISDERSAAFVALGMAQQLGEPVALLCTSGSAGLNYYPAIAEAYYQQIPLLVLTADRPPEWIDQADGQTIRQRSMYANHAKASYELPVDYSQPDAVWQIERTVNEAINICKAYPPAPVHINLPFREPLYPPKDFEMKFDTNVRVIEEVQTELTLSENTWEGILKEWNLAEKILVVGGQDRVNKLLLAKLKVLNLPTLNDIISNLHYLENRIAFQDIFLAKKEIQEELGKADVLITFGKSIISKNLKQYLRNYKPKQHWHIQESGNVPDTFKSLTKIIRCKSSYFFLNLDDKQKINDLTKGNRANYQKTWQNINATFSDKIYPFFEKQKLIPSNFSELEVVFEVLFYAYDNIHLANSMTVRYANYLQYGKPKNFTRHFESIYLSEFFSNRGTSGIDGCLSTAVGHALANPEKMNTLIIGDLAFFYDRNGLWHNYLPENLRIVVLNNHGGNIFKMIDAGSTPEADEYFVTKQTMTAERTAIDAGMEYFYANKRIDFQEIMQTFFEKSGKAKLLEIETDSEINMRILNEYKAM